MKIVERMTLGLVLSILASGAFAQNARSFVSTLGSDANNCTAGAACRSISRALMVTNTGGEIIATDSGGYGPFTVTRSVVVNAPQGVDAAVTVTTGTAVTISAPSAAVVLRGLDINSLGGTFGILEFDVGVLSIENCIVNGFTSAAISANATGQKVSIRDCFVRGCNDGIAVAAGAAIIERTTVIASTGNAFSVVNTGTTVILKGCVAALNAGDGYFIGHSSEATLEDCVASSNGHGVNAGSGAVARVSACTVTNNGIGLLNSSSTIESRQNNTVFGNATNTSGTITPISG